jgi:hypothetical protein
MKTKLRINDFAKLSSVQAIKKNELKAIKGGGSNGVANGLVNFPSQAKGCPPPIQTA